MFPIFLSPSTICVYGPCGRVGEQAVTAYGHDEPLKPGMLLDADVLGEKRSLIEWVLEPIYSIRGTVFGQ